MALAGFCRQCTQYVYLTEQWGCINGHAWNEISGWYDPQTGAPVTPPWMQVAPPVSSPESVVAPIPEPVIAPVVAPAPAAAPSDRLALLADILATFAKYPSFNAQYGTDADIVVDNQLVNANWGTGNKKVDYSAVMKAVEAELTVYFWDIVKESGAGLTFGGFEAESYSVSGKSRSGVQKMMIIGADGAPVEWEWDYAATRSIVEDATARHGWKTKVVLQKKSAQW
ncbi:MAG: hypothetical protein WCJ13_04250 [Coriobacteriia bacterium]